MAIRLPIIMNARKIIRHSGLTWKEVSADFSTIPKGYSTFYVGEHEKKRFMVPLTYLNQPLFQDLLNQAEEEYGFDHPMGGLTIPCKEDIFIELTSRLTVL